MPPTVEANQPLNRLTEAESRSGWELLFDGQSMDEWRNYNASSLSDGWVIRDGAIVRASQGAGDLMTKEKYDAFELSLEYKISPGGNSGMLFHVVEGPKKSWHSGPEIQLIDNARKGVKQKAGWLYELYEPRAPRWAVDKTPVDATRPAGQWNHIYLRVKPGDSEVCLNGNLYYRFDVGSEDWNQRVAASKFAKFEGFGAAGEGHLCLQDHGNEVAFRNIKVRRLSDDGSVVQRIDGDLGMTKTLAFPNLQWDNWEPIDDAGRVRTLRLIELTHARDDSDRLFAVSQQGAIWTFPNRTDATESKMFLDLRGKVMDWKNRGCNEQGLLGLAFHPKFEANGFFYVYYTHPGESKSIVSRFRVRDDDSDRADEDSETIVMEIDQPFKNHNGGSIEFGPDGYLYIGLGDGGDRNDPLGSGQNLATLLGSILRIDVDASDDGLAYGIPKDNPLVGLEGARGEIYAHGVRNPWRIAFDRGTGRLWAGEVGQDRWEEVLLIEKGGNYGWNIREGSYPFGNATAGPDGDYVRSQVPPSPPVWEYDHLIGRSITGGRVFRSTRQPDLFGKYLYADYITGSVWALTVDDATGEAVKNEQVIPDSVPVLAFGEDAEGEIYMLTNSPRGDCIYRFER